MSQFAFDLFLSYAHEDHDLATRMVSWLRKCGFRVWLDEEQLVPGSRFRAGLQQGLRESCHLVALVTAAYTSRSWTQRELDLFDLTADHDERRLLAIQLDDIDFGPLDQLFLVHQRITWRSRSLDYEGFWKLHCGLKGRPPGPGEQWHQNGQALLQFTPQKDSARPRAGDPTTEPTIGRSRPALPSDPIRSELSELAQAVLHQGQASWPSTFLKLRDKVRRLDTIYVLRNQSRQQLSALRTDNDDFHVQGREVYWLCRKKQSGSKISNAVLEKTLGQKSTLRGANTVKKMAAKYSSSKP